MKPKKNKDKLQHNNESNINAIQLCFSLHQHLPVFQPLFGL